MSFVPVFFLFFPLFEALKTLDQIFIIIIWYLIVFAFVFEEFLIWFFHVNIVTDERIIEVDFVNIFYREITDANIDQIQDVTVELGGGLRTLFNFGNVSIQTAAEVPKIKFEAIPKPDDVAKILRDLRVEEEREKIEGRVR
jgi:membrane protein YdbS with pleckstrin-like domain